MSPAPFLAVMAGFFDTGAGRFLISPGFGGAAALLGGVLAFLAARQQLVHSREASRQERWWAAVTWMYDRATATSGRLPGAVALTMLEKLFDEAQTDLEIQTVSGLLDLFPPTDESVGGEGEGQV